MADLDAIKARLAQYRAAIGPGGEKAWAAGQLANDVPTLIADVERLQDAYDTAHADRLARSLERDRAIDEREHLRAENERLRLVVDAARKAVDTDGVDEWNELVDAVTRYDAEAVARG